MPYADVEPLFTEQERLLEAEDWDGAERLWAHVHSQVTLLPDDESETPVSEFLLRIEGDEARLPVLSPSLALAPAGDGVARASERQPGKGRGGRYAIEFGAWAMRECFCARSRRRFAVT